MKSFQHINASTIEDTVKLLKDRNGRARLMAGGTDILGVLKDRILPDYPEVMINIKTIAGLDYITEDAQGLKIGPLVKLADLADSPLIKEKYKVVAEAARTVGTPQLRNMGTIGGNLSQDTRCWYYRYPHSVGGRISCMRKGSGPCLAVAGDNRYHALFGGKGCFAVCPSDLAVALAALDAVVKITGPGGDRTVSILDFFTPLSNILAPDELIIEIWIPNPPEMAAQQFLKYTVRKPVDFAIVSVAALIVMDNGVCTDSRIILGAVAPGPLRAIGAEEYVKGKKLDTDALEEAAELAVKGAKTLSKNGYKIEITKALVTRALSICTTKGNY